MGNTRDTSEKAFQEIVRVLEDAVEAGVDSVALEYKGRDLMVFYQQGNVGLGATHIQADLQQPVVEEIVKRARLERKPEGKMLVTLLGSEYEVIVEEYDSFGETAFDLTLKKAKR